MITWLRTLAACTLLAAAASAPAQNAPNADLVARGRYIATLGDCAACHTAPGTRGKDFAGGYGIASPLGTIFSTNITPSKTHGIGNYSYEDFERAVRRGVARDGLHLYPAMPYDAYAGVTDDDMQALYAFFMHGVKPVDEAPAQATRLPFPFNLRVSMVVWNLLYADGKPFQPEPRLSPEQNRGKYLTDTLAHCASCHSPRGLLMGPLAGQYLKGSDVGPWHAPDITADPRTGLGNWSADEIARYLKTGRVAGKAQAAGPMAEAVEHSFQHVTDADLQAIAAYLKTVGATDAAAVLAAAAAPADNSRGDEASIRGRHPSNAHDSLKLGAELYSGYCASCHQPAGTGSDNQLYPSLSRNSATGAQTTTNLVATILYGVDRDAGGYHALMPHFGRGSYVAELNDQQVADISNYVLTTFGNPAAAKVSTADVQRARSGGPVALLARLQPYIPALIALALLLPVLLVLARRRRKPGRG